MVSTFAGTVVWPVVKWLGEKGSEAVYGNLAQAIAQRGLTAVVNQFSEGKLPANHDITRASRAALKEALSWMHAKLAGAPSSDFRSRAADALRQGQPIPAGPLQPSEHRAWMEALKCLIERDDELRKLEHCHLDGEKVHLMVQTSLDEAAASELHARVRTWLTAHLPGSPPEQLGDFLDAKGWLLDDGKSRLTLYQAWCWHFRQHLKKEPEAFNSFVATALADLLGRRAPHVDAAANFGKHLDETLGERALDQLQLMEAKLSNKLDAIMLRFGISPESSAGGDVVDRLLQHESLNAAQNELLEALIVSAEIRDETLSAVVDSPVQGLRGYLLSCYARACQKRATTAWLHGGDIRFDDEFLGLQLVVIPEFDQATEQRFDALSDMLAQSGNVHAWVLVGDAGSGKTTLLRHHETEAARRLLQQLNETGDDSTPEADLCIWLRLSTYRRDRAMRWPDCDEWLQEQWESHPQTKGLPPLTTLRNRFHVRLLLDGVNEIEAGADPSLRHEAMRQFGQWVDKHKFTQRAPVFTVRRHDRGLAQLGAADLFVREAGLAPWSDERVEQFCRRRYSGHGELWKRLKSDPHLMAICRTPFNLSAQCALLDEGCVAGNRADLFLGMVWLKLKWAVEKGDFVNTTGLLTSMDFGKIKSAHWRNEASRRNLPSEGTLLRGLVEQARKMMLELEVDYEDVARFGWQDFDRQGWLSTVQALGLAEARTGARDTFAFAHQLWQEFFLARGLIEKPELIGDMARRGPQATANRCAAAPQTPDVVNMDEAVRLAVQLTPQPEQFVSRLMSIDPALAGRSAADLPNLSPGVASQLRRTLLDLSRDRRLQLQRRIEAAEALGLMGDDIRYERCERPGVCPLLPRRGPIVAGGHASGWIDVSGGAYVIGRHVQPDDEEPIDCGPGGQPLLVEVGAFSIAFAPVTNAEFALFVEDGGYLDDHWWPGEAPRRWLGGELRDEGGREWQMERYTALVEDFDSAIKRFFFEPTPTNLEFARSISALSRVEAEAKFDAWYPWSGSPPAFLDVSDFSNPLQPVVGVSVFEAEAYCRWLSARTGIAFRLPTEAEWAAAAQGRQRRTWPWGDEPPADQALNCKSLRLGRTSPIGVFPFADSPEGLVDLAGNVWEWTASAFTREGLVPTQVNAMAPPMAFRAVRGGAHEFGLADCRLDFRFKCNPLVRSKAVGFRLVCALP
jgi:formylglycine-generating enzyme required for sulfatase activity